MSPARLPHEAAGHSRRRAGCYCPSPWKGCRPMTWIHSLFAFRNARLVQEAADQLTARVWPWVWQRVQRRVVHMTPAEARGYIRAHASEMVRASAATMVQEHESLQAWAEESIVEQSLEGLVTLGVTEVVNHQRQLRREQIHREQLRRAA